MHKALESSEYHPIYVDNHLAKRGNCLRDRKKLIEVAIPLEAINVASAREKSIRHGHPSTLHLWWARRPLAAARAVIFAQMVDDPSSRPELFPDEEAQERERQRLFAIIEDLVKWESTTNEEVLDRARAEIRLSWRRTCEDNTGHPRAQELFDPDKLPAFHDPFAGGGSLPLEAQRLGLEAHASDLNPVAVLINKAMIEIPPKFAGKPPVNPESRTQDVGPGGVVDGTALSGTGGLAEGDGVCKGDLPARTDASPRGDLRDEVLNHPCCGVGSSQHRRGLDEGIGEGTRSVPVDSTEIAGGNRDLSDSVRGDRLVSGGEDGVCTQPDHRSEQDAQHLASQAARKRLSPGSYQLFTRAWRGAEGLAEDVRYYGQWMRDEAEKRIGHLYPQVEITPEMAVDRPDLATYVGRQLTVIAWLWARTVKSPNPAYAGVDVPLASTFMLSTKPGKEAYVEPVIENGGYRFTVMVGKPKDAERSKRGTKSGSSGSSFLCLMSGTPMPFEYLRPEAKTGRMGTRLMAIVAEGDRGRVYLAPTQEMEAIALSAEPKDVPETDLPAKALGFRVQEYGMTRWRDLFTPRQLVALTTFSDLVGEAMLQVRADALAAGLPDDPTPLRDGGTGASAYSEAVGVYLAFALSKQADLGNSLCRWEPIAQCPRQLFGRQAIPMVWDFAESNPLGQSSGSWVVCIDGISKAFAKTFEYVHLGAVGSSQQGDAATQDISRSKVISTDPPYYDNIGYADLSDFFYVWLRRSLRACFPALFATLAVPKAEELVATPYRHGSREKAEAFFLSGMTRAMHKIVEQAHPAFPVTIYYAFKQAESENDTGIASTGWETFLDAVIRAGFAVTGTWPMRTENDSRMIGQGTNALASSIVLVCRRRPSDAPMATRRDFLTCLQAELAPALEELLKCNIAPVDLRQACIGPGMAVFTRFSRVLEADGSPMPVRAALGLINAELDSFLSRHEGDLDRDTRFCLEWFKQFGFSQGPFGSAEVMSKAFDTSVDGMARDGTLVSRAGKVSLTPITGYTGDWAAAADSRRTVWEATHYLASALGTSGEESAARLYSSLDRSLTTPARDLGYRLYTICEQKGWSQEGTFYNGLVVSWPEITRLAEKLATSNDQGELGL